MSDYRGELLSAPALGFKRSSGSDYCESRRDQLRTWNTGELFFSYGCCGIGANFQAENRVLRHGHSCPMEQRKLLLDAVNLFSVEDNVRPRRAIAQHPRAAVAAIGKRMFCSGRGGEPHSRRPAMKIEN